MMLFQRNAHSNDGWEFVGYVEQGPFGITNGKEYKYFWIGME